MRSHQHEWWLTARVRCLANAKDLPSARVMRRFSVAQSTESSEHGETDPMVTPLLELCLSGGRILPGVQVHEGGRRMTWTKRRHHELLLLSTATAHRCDTYIHRCTLCKRRAVSGSVQAVGCGLQDH